MLSKQLDVNFFELFELKSKEILLSAVDEILQYEDKLTKDKAEFYTGLKRRIVEGYIFLNNEQS